MDNNNNDQTERFKICSYGRYAILDENDNRVATATCWPGDVICCRPGYKVIYEERLQEYEKYPNVIPKNKCQN